MQYTVNEKIANQCPVIQRTVQVIIYKLSLYVISCRNGTYYNMIPLDYIEFLQLEPASQ